MQFGIIEQNDPDVSHTCRNQNNSFGLICLRLVFTARKKTYNEEGEKDVFEFHDNRFIKEQKYQFSKYIMMAFFS